MHSFMPIWRHDKLRIIVRVWCRLFLSTNVRLDCYRAKASLVVADNQKINAKVGKNFAILLLTCHAQWYAEEYEYLCPHPTTFLMSSGSVWADKLIVVN